LNEERRLNMSKSVNAHKSLKTILKSSAVGTMAAVMLVTGFAVPVSQSFADPVQVDAPQVASFADVVEAVTPAVVSVRVQSETPESNPNSNAFSFNFGGRSLEQLPDDHPLKRFFRDFGGDPSQGEQRQRPERNGGKLRPTSQGSGFFISEDGYIVTNNHVINDGKKFTVVMTDGTEYDAKLVGSDSRTDLAVLKVDVNREFTYVKFAEDSKVRVGDWVVAVGNPFGLGGTVTSGIVSARGRDIGSGPYDDYLQIDAAVNRGNSGGPAFNLEGNVVGINTAIFSPSGGNVGIAFAIPASVAKDVVDSLMKGGSVKRGWLGVQIQPVSKDIAESLGLEEAKGALVVAPQAGSPGDKAGIKEGDIITAVDGNAIKDARDLSRRIGGMTPDTDVKLSVWRDGETKEVTVTLGNLASDDAKASNDSSSEEKSPATEKLLSDLGIKVAPKADGGLEIVDVDQDSDAAIRGIRAGESIASVNNQPVKSVADLEKVLEQAKKDGRAKALFQIQSESGSRFIPLDINEG
jgi:serine protease Do